MQSVVSCRLGSDARQRQKTVQCTHLRAEQHRTRHHEYVAADALIRSGQHNQISDAQQRQQHEQRFGRFAVLARFDRVGRAQFGDEDLCVCVTAAAAQRCV